MGKLRKFIRIKVKVEQSDIDGGAQCLADRCMEKVAIERALRKLPGEESKDHKVRIDAGHFKFNLKGYRYKGDTAKKARAALITFDRRKDLVEPHEWVAKAYQTTKIEKTTPERREQINEARRQRIAEGGNERKRRYKLRERIVGFDLGHG